MKQPMVWGSGDYGLVHDVLKSFREFHSCQDRQSSFPEINHDLNFLIRHFPSAYGRPDARCQPYPSGPADPNEAGTLYGNIIYNKAPIMMQ